MCVCVYSEREAPSSREHNNRLAHFCVQTPFLLDWHFRAANHGFSNIPDILLVTQSLSATWISQSQRLFFYSLIYFWFWPTRWRPAVGAYGGIFNSSSFFAKFLQCFCSAIVLVLFSTRCYVKYASLCRHSISRVLKIWFPVFTGNQMVSHSQVSNAFRVAYSVSSHMWPLLKLKRSKCLFHFHSNIIHDFAKQLFCQEDLSQYQPPGGATVKLLCNLRLNRWVTSLWWKMSSVTELMQRLIYVLCLI